MEWSLTSGGPSVELSVRNSETKSLHVIPFQIFAIQYHNKADALNIKRSILPYF